MQGLLLRITQKSCYVRVSVVWELQAHVVDSRGIWLGGVSTGMLSSSFAVARASLPSTSVLRVACRKRNDVPLYSSKLSQEGLALQLVVFSPSQICVNTKREGNSGSCTHQRNQVSQKPYKIYQTKEMCMISAFLLLFLVDRLYVGVQQFCFYLLFSEVPILIIKCMTQEALFKSLRLGQGGV